MRGNLIIISSPSGGGKGTIIKEVLKTVSNVGYSVSYTTRNMREGERNGVDYHFVTRAEFEQLIEKGDFLEYAEVHGNLYGTSASRVETETRSGRDIILEIDVQGASLVLEKVPDAVSVFILPPSFEVLRVRLASRATENAEELKLRLRNSFEEIKFFSNFKYLIINDVATKAVADLTAIITAERLRSIRQTDDIQVILDSFDVSKYETGGE